MGNPPANLTLGFIGLGLMGGLMTSRLLSAGFQVTVWNRSSKKTEAAVQQGATAAKTPADLAERSDIVMLCVKDTQAVCDVVFGADGICEKGSAEKLLVDFSSIDPETTKEFSVKLEQSCGMRWIDSPVSGGTPAAEGGTLIAMVGGLLEDIHRVSPALKCLMQRITHMGGVGSGQLTKVCNQILVGCGIAAVSEVIRLAEINDMDVARLPECLAGGFADSTVLQYHAPRMIERQLSARGFASNMLKDMNIACATLRRSNTTAPLTGLTTELYRLLVNQGHGDLDQIGLIKLYDSPDAN